MTTIFLVSVPICEHVFELIKCKYNSYSISYRSLYHSNISFVSSAVKIQSLSTFSTQSYMSWCYTMGLVVSGCSLEPYLQSVC